MVASRTAARNLCLVVAPVVSQPGGQQWRSMTAGSRRMSSVAIVAASVRGPRTMCEPGSQPTTIGAATVLRQVNWAASASSPQARQAVSPKPGNQRGGVRLSSMVRIHCGHCRGHLTVVSHQLVADPAPVLPPAFRVEAQVGKGTAQCKRAP